MNRGCVLNLFLIFLILTVNDAYADGSVSGIVTFEGKAPRARIIRMDADTICLAKRKEFAYTQSFVLGEGGTLGNVFVHVKNIDSAKKYPVPTEMAVLDQKGCNYFPHVMVVRAGQKVKVLNPDGTLHNVHAQSKINREFNEAMPHFRTEMIKVFDRPESMFAIRCDVHPWMLAWMAVLEHPFFAVTKMDGQFEIKNLPAGTYEIEAWHEKLGVQTIKVNVVDGVNEKIGFTFVAPK